MAGAQGHVQGYTVCRVRFRCCPLVPVPVSCLRGPGGGLRPGPGAWVAAGGRGGRGPMRVRGAWRSRGGAGGPAGGRQWP